MQSVSYVEPRISNKFPNYLKTAISVNYFKHGVKKYFLKRLSDTDGDIFN